MSEMIYKVLEIPSRPPTPVKLNPVLGKTKFLLLEDKNDER